METVTPHESLIPPALFEKVKTRALAEQRSPSDILREAIESYLQEHPTNVSVSHDVDHSSKLTPQEAAARILERRKLHPMPASETIKDLINFGRAGRSLSSTIRSP